MKGILKQRSIQPVLTFSSRDLDRVMIELPEDVVRRKCMVIQELQTSFRLMRGEQSDATDVDAGMAPEEEPRVEAAGQNSDGHHWTSTDVPRSFPIHENPFGSPNPYRIETNGRSKSKTSSEGTQGDFLSQLRQELSCRQLSYAKEIEEEQHGIAEVEPIDDGHDSLNGASTQPLEAEKATETFYESESRIEAPADDRGSSDPPTIPLIEEEEEPDIRPTVREFERERRRAVREQTVMTKPLVQWRLPEDRRGTQHHGTNDDGGSDRWSMPPEQRIAFLRLLNDRGSSDSPTPRSPVRKSSVQSDHSSSSLSSVVSTESSGGESLGAKSKGTPTVPFDQSTVENSVHTERAPAPPSPSPPPSSSLLLTSPRSGETGELRRFWEQRIDEYEKNRPLEHSSGESSSKKWKSLEVLTASLLSTLPQTPTSQSPHIISADRPTPLEHSSRTAANGESTPNEPPLDYSDCRRRVITGDEMAQGGDNGYFGTENGSSSYNRPLNSHVVRESIADAHRTRQMWQEMAASNEAQQQSCPPHVKTGRGAISYSTNSLPRKMTLATEAPAAGHQPNGGGGLDNNHIVAEAVRWRSGSGGPSAQMERQIKEQRRQSGSLVRNTIHVFETDGAANTTVDRGASRPSLMYSICQSRGGEDSDNHLDDRSAHQNGENGTIDSSLEHEKQLFIDYVRGHPEVVRSLGISVPWRVIQQEKSSPGVKVGLAVIETPPSDTQHVKVDTITNGSSNPQSNGTVDRDTNGIHRAHLYEPHHDQQHQQHRYVKNNSASSLSSGGSLKAIVRRQSQSDSGPPNGGLNFTVCNSGNTTIPRQWKLAEWEPPPPPCNKEEATNDDPTADGYVDEIGNVYRSAGESLIAKEIREYRAREEELRRSRSELGLPNIEDIMSSSDQWKSTVGFEGGRLRDARSCARLQVITDHERGPAGASSPSGGKCWFDGGDGRPASAGPTLRGQQSPQSPTQHVIGGGGHKVAAYPPDLGHRTTSSEEGSLDGVFSSQTTGSEGDFMPVETRIEREVEDLRRREVELKMQREAMGIRYYPVGLSQFTPRSSLIDFDPIPIVQPSSNENVVSYGGDGTLSTTIREYRRSKTPDLVKTGPSVLVQDDGERATDGLGRHSELEGIRRMPADGSANVEDKDSAAPDHNSTLRATHPAERTVASSALIEKYVDSMVSSVVVAPVQLTVSPTPPPPPVVPSAPRLESDTSIFFLNNNNKHEIVSNQTTTTNQRTSYLNIEDILVSI